MNLNSLRVNGHASLIERHIRRLSLTAGAPQQPRPDGRRRASRGSQSQCAGGSSRSCQQSRGSVGLASSKVLSAESLWLVNLFHLECLTELCASLHVDLESFLVLRISTKSENFVLDR